MVRTTHAEGAGARDERGFSLVELMIAALITTAIVGAAVTMASQVQTVYSVELNDAAVQQEVRYAMEWITRTLAPAGSNPYEILTSACPATGTTFAAIRLDPDGDSVNDDIRVQADINPPNGVVLGLTGVCTESGEDVTIAHDSVNSTITRYDRALETTPQPITDGVFTQLLFTYLNSSRTATAVADDITYIQVSLTGRSRSRNPYTGQYTTFTYTKEVRVRAR